MSRRGRRQRLILGALLGPLLGAGLGAALAPAVGGAFQEPAALAQVQWRLLIPGLQEMVVQPHLGRGTQLRDGALWLGEHAFGRVDTLRPADTRPVSEVRIEVVAGSVMVNFPGDFQGSAGPAPSVTLRPGGAQLPGRSEWGALPEGPARLTVEGEGASREIWLHLAGGPTSLGASAPTSVEVNSTGGGALASLTLIDEGGAALATEDFAAEAPPPPVAAGAAVGALAGLALGLALGASAGPGGAALALLAAALAALALGVPYRGWVSLGEGLYLSQTRAWTLSRLALLVSLAPLVWMAAARVLPPPTARRERSRARWLYPGACAAAGLLASRGGQWLWFVPGTLYLLHGWRVAQQARLPGPGWLAREAPALVSVAWLGWGLGLLPAALWRFVPVVSSSRTLLERAPRAAADHLFLLLLALPLSAELALRSTYLSDAWSPEALAGQSGDSGPLLPFWKDRCGPAGATRELSLVFGGGSSTGGAYQFRSRPEAFFPAVVHRQLCAALPPETALTTWNYGEGGRDTHILSRAMGALLETTGADMVVLYVGVNDLLTTDSPMTRRQREALSGEGAGAPSVAGRSRLLTGLALGLRELRAAGSPEQALVSEVPIEDARDNLGRIAGEAAEVGARVLLVSQHITPNQAHELEVYWAAERALAEREANVDFVDARPALQGEDTLLDRNHLTERGHELLAGAMLGAISEALLPGGGAP